jgi:hypothetical protein
MVVHIIPPVPIPPESRRSSSGASERNRSWWRRRSDGRVIGIGSTSIGRCMIGDLPEATAGTGFK